MEFIFEIFLQFLGELLLQAIFEALFELGLHSLADMICPLLSGPKSLLFWTTIEPAPIFGPALVRKPASFYIRTGMPALM